MPRVEISVYLLESNNGFQNRKKNFSIGIIGAPGLKKKVCDLESWEQGMSLNKWSRGFWKGA